MEGTLYRSLGRVMPWRLMEIEMGLPHGYLGPRNDLKAPVSRLAVVGGHTPSLRDERLPAVDRRPLRPDPALAERGVEWLAQRIEDRTGMVGG